MEAQEVLLELSEELSEELLEELSEELSQEGEDFPCCFHIFFLHLKRYIMT